MHLLAEPKGHTGQNWLKVVRVQTKLLLKQAGLVISICISLGLNLFSKKNLTRKFATDLSLQILLIHYISR